MRPVLIVGSLNIDYIAAVERLPAPGETVAATQLIQRFGGKGANQAIAAVRQRVPVSMLGCVGADDAGRAYCKRLRSEGINAAGISTTRRALTGTALIAVDQSAENTIVVAAGANGELKLAAIRAQRARIAAASLLLLQLEVPMATVIEAVRQANRAQVPVVLNPSPLRDGFPWGKCQLDTVIANAGEAQAIFGLPIEQLSASLPEWRSALATHRIGWLIITRGAQSTLCLSATDFFEVPTLAVKPVDTVGAGDAFAGTFVARRAEGADVATAVRYANCAGALATLKAGAQEAIPNRSATEKACRFRHHG
ncbi:MAG TPA: ribokinase [Bacillota bacterium]|nr:ribokinase [Bacillota bacterium]